MWGKLPIIELLFYFVFWLVTFSIAVVEFYKRCREVETHPIFADWALTEGFFSSFKYREKLDHDITVIFDLGINFVCLGVGHVVIRHVLFSLIIRPKYAIRDSALLIYLFTYGLFATTYMLGYSLMAFFLFMVLANYFIVQQVFAVLPMTKKLSPLCRAWIIAVIQTFSMMNIADFASNLTDSNSVRIAFVWSVGWYQLRFISFIDFNSRYHTSFLHFIGYVFNFPVFFAPFVSYTRFLLNNSLRHDNENEKVKKSLDLPFRSLAIYFVKEFLYIGLWTLFIVFLNHAFFPMAFAFYQEMYLQTHPLGRVGHAWMMGQWFQAKYMLLYGAPWIISFLDTGAPLPGVPVFITRIYRYSVMWRRFDTGLYEFMRDHLYGPSLATMESYIAQAKGRTVFHSSPTFRKIFALLLTYFFVGIWHGLSTGVLLFAAMNFANLVFEFGGKAISDAFKLSERLSPSNHRRLTAFACLFNVQWSWWSFFFFMADWENGLFIVKNLYNAPLWTRVAPGIFSIYCWVHLCMEIEPYLDPQRPDDATSKETSVEKQNTLKQANSKKRK